jgi:mRNA interferase YafQ
MLNPVYTRQFERDVKRMKRRGKNLEKLKIVIRSLVAEEALDPIHRDHKLIGNWLGKRECHIESN